MSFNPYLYYRNNLRICLILALSPYCIISIINILSINQIVLISFFISISISLLSLRLYPWRIFYYLIWLIFVFYIIFCCWWTTCWRYLCFCSLRTRKFLTKVTDYSVAFAFIKLLNISCSISWKCSKMISRIVYAC